MVSHLRTLLISGLFICGSLSVQAQVTPTPTAPTTKSVDTSLKRPGEVSGKYKDYLKQRYANDQKAKAVINLFGRKQTGGALWLSTGAAFIGFVSTQTGTQTNGSGTTTFTVTPLGYLSLVSLFGGIGLGKLSRFNNTKLYEALMQHDNQKTFPDYVEDKLKDKDYK